MPTIREFFEQVATLFQAANTAIAGQKFKKKKAKPKKSRTFRGGEPGSIDLINYNPKDANKNAQRGGNPAALKSQDLCAGGHANGKKKEPPTLQGRSKSCLSNNKIGVAPKVGLKRSI